ncbi:MULTISPECIES: CDP-diacylglycerol--glycerol-3-phosphate 3-phosphatidyltransferase [Candidatus Ichthyocystis]|uniref:CDP-diacylglycerol--glycerol-3-phosphate 3-phosphatidyltransferase n=1 Tax=Candidatus Ichthyocystis TaxID=2929841 RepID=UPI000A5BC962|nr:MULTISPECIES: CDP-diacylglycerol--glycerol-3-phosphate 3-phosphatidyltransferase [Ichthyocystis]
MMTFPNFLTLFRMVLIPFFVICYCFQWHSDFTRDIAATTIFAIAAITDAFDGYFARILNQSSRLGSFLDPVADKLLVVSALCVLLHLGRLPTWMVIVMIGREITVSALREWMAIVGQSKSVAVCMLGKLKTVSQLSAIPLALANLRLYFIDTLLIGQFLMLVAVVMTLISMTIYMCAAWPYLEK